jgi:hypothetical protein
LWDSDLWGRGLGDIRSRVEEDKSSGEGLGDHELKGVKIKF